MSTIDNIISMPRDDLKAFIKGLFKSDKLKTDLINDLAFKNEQLENMLKIAYCQKTGADNPIGLDCLTISPVLLEEI